MLFSCLRQPCGRCSAPKHRYQDEPKKAWVQWHPLILKQPSNSSARQTLPHHCSRSGVGDTAELPSPHFISRTSVQECVRPSLSWGPCVAALVAPRVAAEPALMTGGLVLHRPLPQTHAAVPGQRGSTLQVKHLQGNEARHHAQPATVKLVQHLLIRCVAAVTEGAGGQQPHRCHHVLAAAEVQMRKVWQLRGSNLLQRWQGGLQQPV